MKKVILDTNCLIIYVLGLINPSLIEKHKKTSLYDETDFTLMQGLIKSPDNLLILPNIWTEVDNLLNRHLNGNNKYYYIETVKKIMEQNVEKYLESKIAANDTNMYDIGITDTLILKEALSCELLITADSDLSDRANGWNVKVFDFKKYKNDKIKPKYLKYT
jgi:rRNA-processing protein FCF1